MVAFASLLFCSALFIGALVPIDADCAAANPNSDPNLVSLDQNHPRAYVHREQKYPSSKKMTACAWLRLASDSGLDINVPLQPSAFVRFGTTKPGMDFMFAGDPKYTNFVRRDWTPDWSHICFTLDESRLTVYVNGSLFGFVHAVDYSLGTVDLTHVEMSLTKGSTGGSISDVHYYNRILTPNEVQQVACDPSSAPKDLIGWKDAKVCIVSANSNGTEDHDCPPDAEVLPEDNSKPECSCNGTLISSFFPHSCVDALRQLLDAVAPPSATPDMSMLSGGGAKLPPVFPPACVAPLLRLLDAVDIDIDS